ncbi:MAG: SulP family inorganic anion transporter [Candidatus Melainabacteria bacterium]|nr:SulP family inorganic anion transporter [Candidatus Melainabacteria bacterium]
MEQKSIRQQLFSNVQGDLFGGLTAAIVALPIALAFGVTTGLGAEAGLYGAIIAGLFAAIFGGTPGQITGPTGPMSVVVAAMVADHAGRPELVFAAVALGGLFQILLGKLKAGELIQYFPYPVVSGFMTGIGMIIILIEINPFFGIKGEGDVLAAVQDFARIPAEANLHALLVGSITLATIYLIPLLSRLLKVQLPAALIALIAGTAASVLMPMELPRIGHIPQGLPMPQLKWISLAELHVVMHGAVSLAILGAIDSLLTSVVMDKITRKKHDSNQELVGQGIGNFVAGIFGGLPSAGATMRSVVNINAGGRTKLSGVLHSLFLVAVLVGAGQYAAEIPQACLAAILFAVGVSILDKRALRTIKRTPRSDVIVMTVVLLFTVFVDLIFAVVVGVALACILFAKSLSDKSGSDHGMIDSIDHMQEEIEHLPPQYRDGVYVYSFHGPLFFGEVKNFNDAVDKLPRLRYLILRFYNVPFIDQTGALSLEEAVEKCKDRGTQVIFVGVKPHIMKILRDVHTIEVIGAKNFVETFDQALDIVTSIQIRTHDRLPALKKEDFEKATDKGLEDQTDETVDRT